MTREALPHVDSPSLQTFAVVARQYCDVVEAHERLEREQFLRAIHVVLPRLYLAALNLPPTDLLFEHTGETPSAGSQAVGPSQGPSVDADRLDVEHAASPEKSLRNLIADWNYYRAIFDAYEPTTEPEVTGSLSDDFSDIYRDVRTGLAKWQRGETGEALWDWRFDFEHHWGEHLTSALRALHVLTSTYEYPWPDPESGPA